MNSLVLTYIPGVCVFPALSSFTPGWVRLGLARSVLRHERCIRQPSCPHLLRT